MLKKALVAVVLMALGCAREPLCRFPAPPGGLPCADVLSAEVGEVLHVQVEEPYICWSDLTFDGIACLHEETGTIQRHAAPPDFTGLMDYFVLSQHRVYTESPWYFELRGKRYVPVGHALGIDPVAAREGLASVVDRTYVFQHWRYGVPTFTYRVPGGTLEFVRWGRPPQQVLRRADLDVALAIESGHIVYRTSEGFRSVRLTDGLDRRLVDWSVRPSWAVAVAAGRVFYHQDGWVRSLRVDGSGARSHFETERPPLALAASEEWIVALVQEGGELRVRCLRRGHSVQDCLALATDGGSPYPRNALALVGGRLYVMGVHGTTLRILRTQLDRPPDA